MRKTLLATFTTLMLTLGASIATAAPFSFVVNVDTTTLIGSAEPLWLDFLLIDGGPGSEPNTVTISSFAFTGAGAGPVPGTVNAFGGVTGDLSGTVELTDTDFFNDFFQEFTPGNSLSFLVTTTANFTGPTPDQFSFSILRGDPPLNIPTSDFTGNNVLLFLDINALSLGLGNLETFQSPDLGDGAVTTAEPGSAPVPEPASLLLLGLGMAGLAARRWSVRKRRAMIVS